MVVGIIVFCFIVFLVEVIIIFVLVCFSWYLGVFGKFFICLLFDIKKGEEYLIMLKYFIMRNNCKCVKMDFVRIENVLLSGIIVE